MVDLAVDRYLRLLARIQSEPEANPELSLRELLLELLRAFGGDAGRRGLMVAPRPVLGRGAAGHLLPRPLRPATGGTSDMALRGLLREVPAWLVPGQDSAYR